MCAVARARGRKSKKAAALSARESRRFGAATAHRGTRRVREISLGFLESRDFLTKRRNRYDDPPRLVSRAASWESSRVRDSRIRPTRRVRLFSTAELARKDFARNRLRPRFPIRCATDSNDSSILVSGKPRHGNARRVRRRRSVFREKRRRLRRRGGGPPPTLLHSYAPLRQKNAEETEITHHATLSKMNVPPPPFARPMSVSSSRYVT